MLLRTPGRLIPITALLAGFAALLCPAQQASSTAPADIRYHFGDDRDGKLGWANPNFDDSAWPVAKDGRWPIPPLYSDGFVWVRLHIAVRSRASLPLAVRSSPPFLIAVDTERHALEIYAGGALVGRQGSLPPEVDLDLDHRDAIFDLPASAASPGTTTLLALRTWYPPAWRGPTSFTTWIISVDENRVLQLAHRADHATITYANLLDLELNGLMVLLGVGVFFAWRWLGGRDLLVFSWVLIAHALFELSANPSLPGLGAISWRTQWIIQLGIAFPALLADVEFTWTVHGLRAIKLKRLVQAFAVALAIVALYFVLPTTPTALTFWAGPVYLLAFLGFSLTLVGVNLWAILVRRRNQLIAVAIIAYATAAFLTPVGVLPVGVMVGPFYEHTLGLAFFLFAIALFLLLSQRAWRAWRARDELRVEFEAAREVQERLVAPAVNLPGFKIQSKYLPAKHVGGDFFRVLPEADGSVLVVVGDVSGKGLRAAMTVSAIIGALRTMPVLPPARILAALNRGLVGQIGIGFVTCCVARIALDGTAEIANAGNLSPYVNGAELKLSPGLPLGIAATVEYEETQFKFESNQTLTFVSDGVVEARNAAGELFGFERTRAISAESANQIAKTAELFGQEDDITVLTLMREPAEAAPDPQLSLAALSA
jgi:sigma-B regulation protein RsbU (phosphoserine phosphatase)